MSKCNRKVKKKVFTKARKYGKIKREFILLDIEERKFYEKEKATK